MSRIIPLRPALKPFCKWLKEADDKPRVGMPRYFPGDYLPVVQVLDAVEAERPLKARKVGYVLDKHPPQAGGKEAAPHKIWYHHFLRSPAGGVYLLAAAP